MESKRSNVQVNVGRANARVSKTQMMKATSEVSLSPSQMSEQAKLNAQKNPLDVLSRSVRFPNAEKRSGLQDVDESFIKNNYFSRRLFARHSGLNDNYATEYSAQTSAVAAQSMPQAEVQYRLQGGSDVMTNAPSSQAQMQAQQQAQMQAQQQAQMQAQQQAQMQAQQHAQMQAQQQVQMQAQQQAQMQAQQQAQIQAQQQAQMQAQQEAQMLAQQQAQMQQAAQQQAQSEEVAAGQNAGTASSQVQPPASVSGATSVAPPTQISQGNASSAGAGAGTGHTHQHHGHGHRHAHTHGESHAHGHNQTHAHNRSLGHPGYAHTQPAAGQPSYGSQSRSHGYGHSGNKSMPSAAEQPPEIPPGTEPELCTTCPNCQTTIYLVRSSEIPADMPPMGNAQNVPPVN